MSNPDVDYDGDGKVTRREKDDYESKAINRRRMAWLSLIAMVATGFCLMFLVKDERLAKLDGLLELYWLGLGSIVAAYVGISTWSAGRR